ncbi:MAG TPA: class I SAM-dependent methyltransferase [Gemmatimonadaceae bacterium]|nr:class I SAM-dependent methyltransferase [Gemmatimonadaceae bacterium]
MSCCECEGIATQFGRETARRELRRFRRRGPRHTTQLLLDDLRAAGIAGGSLLDIGGGIGAIHHTLLDAGAREAVHVDVSPDYIAAAQDEAGRRGHADRVRFIHADFVEAANELPSADVVTLDRVICCYPDMDLLVGTAARKARRFFSAVYPRDAWWVRSVVRTINVILRVRRTAFRVFVHSPAAIDSVLRGNGLEQATLHRTAVWEVVVYRTRQPEGAASA